MLILALVLNNLMTLISLLWPRILKPIIKQTKWHICIQFFDFWRTCQWQRSCELVLLTCVEALCQLTSLCVSQRCGPGFYRERAGPHRGQCVPCRCSGFSSECEAQTGKCMVGVQEMQQQSGAAAIVWRALTSPSVPANHSRSLKHVYIKSAIINRIVVAHRTVGSTLPVTAVNAVKRVITEVPWTGRARPVHAPPPRTSPLLLLFFCCLLPCVCMRSSFSLSAALLWPVWTSDQEWWSVCVNEDTSEPTVRGDHVRLKSSIAFFLIPVTGMENTSPTLRRCLVFTVVFLRCAFGYYGNPVKDGGSCKPCSCKHNNRSICDPLTGGNKISQGKRSFLFEENRFQVFNSEVNEPILLPFKRVPLIWWQQQWLP